MVLVTDEEQIAPHAFRVCRYLRNSLEYGSLKIEFQHHAKNSSQAWIHADREIESQHLTRLEHRPERCQWLGLSGLNVTRIRASRWTEGAMYRGIVVEQR